MTDKQKELMANYLAEAPDYILNLMAENPRQVSEMAKMHVQIRKQVERDISGS